jgi:hypothetical protein
MPQGEQVAIITGSSSGIGYETSLMLARNGFHTYATMRNSQMKTKISESLNQAVQNAMHPSEVAKAILEAITSDNPDFRYPVGKDANTTIEARKNMSDAGFQDLLRKQFNLQNVS